MSDAPLPAPAGVEDAIPAALEHVALVLQGGGALGAYQAGVYAALAEAAVEVDWICGISIGAINAALIVGNPPERRVERLRQFWQMITEPPIQIPGLPQFADLPWGLTDEARSWTQRMSAFTNMVYGATNFFTPRPLPPWNMQAESPAGVSFYDTAPLRATLEKLVDFDRINAKPIRISVGATNVKTGAPVFFDNLERNITVAHIMASAALPPSFPPVEIDGEYFWDGGVVSNSAMQHVVDSRPRYSALAFQVDLWDADGEVPRDITGANLRATEIHGASRINMSLEEFRELQHMRMALRRLLDEVPEEHRNKPEIQKLAEEARLQVATVVLLKYQARKHEGASKVFDFSRASMETHWRAGYEDAQIALNEPELFEAPDIYQAARVFDVHRGWIG